MRIWTIIQKNLDISRSVSRATKIAKNPDFTPCTLDSGFEKWADDRLIFIAQLFKGQTMKSFEQLKQEFNLTNKDFYKYLQLRHYLRTHKEWEKLTQEPSKIETLFMLCSKYNALVKKGLISNLDKALQDEFSMNNMAVKEKWELEANIIIRDIDWEETFQSGHKLTNSPTWREFEWKVKMRYFNTPSITSKYSNTSDLCWRNCGKVGDFTHIFWDCPKLLDFWKSIQWELGEVLGINLPLDPSTYILGIMPDDLIDHERIYLLRVLLLIAKKTITSLWLKPQPPNIMQWKERVRQVTIMERITARIQLKLDTYEKRWEPIIQMISEPKHLW